MATVAHAAATGSPHALRRRSDLRVFPAPSNSSSRLVEDAPASRYYELSADEYFLWRQFDGRTSADEICRRYERTFAPRRLDLRRLDDFAARAYRQGLLYSDTAGQGAALLRQGAQARFKRLGQAMLNPLAVRLPGIDPEPLLARLAPWANRLFSRSFLLATGVLAAAAVITAIIHAGQLSDELSAATSRVTPHLLVSLALTTAVAKCIHELAHAAACRKFGANCREIGVMLLVGMPCLYCDVTSVWTLPERWKRIIVGAAGILAELWLAAAAVLLWNASGPGLFHDLCLQLAVVCSLATIVFNGNPLLRYDGYFILSDFAGVTNLAQRADAALRNIAARFFGADAEPAVGDDVLRRPNLWALYAAASWAYRLALTFVIWRLLREASATVGLTIIADAVLGLSLFGMTVGPARQARRFVRDGFANGTLDRRRFTFRSAGACVLLAVVLFWPWPYRVGAPAVVQAAGGRHLFVAAPGQIVASRRLGETVAAGDVIARLENLDAQREVERLRSDVLRRRTLIAILERRRIDSPSVGDELPAAREALQAAEARLQLQEEEHARLKIVAPVGGVLLPLPQKLAEAPNPSNLPPSGSRFSSPFEPERRGRYLASGTPLCTIGTADRREALLVVAQREIEFVRAGAEVRLQFDAAGTQTWYGRIVESTALTPDDAPAELIAAGQVALESDADGRPRPATGQYLVRATIDESAAALPVGAIGQAKIEAESRSLASRMLRFASETFRITRRD